jgi:hypothetical protein
MAGLVWPMPGDAPVYPNTNWARTYREAGFTWVRMDVPVGRDRENAETSVAVLRHAGLQVWPILSWPSAEPDVAAMCGYAEWYIETFPGSRWIELGNEPWILDKIPAGEYLRIAEPMAEAIERAHPTVRVIFAMDLFDHVDGKERGWPGVDDVIACIARNERRYADIHPYRNPYRPTYSPWGSRDKEYRAIAERLGHQRIVYGEIGWKPSEGPGQASGEYHVEELDIARHHDIPLVGIYCHVADLENPAFDFGLWLASGNTLTPRPAATAVSTYLQEPG